ncbi:HipA domain-containing protein [Paraburkholderia lycopersici]|uniref:HipA-like C-terminal domain-containing protein n=1 Tax=Paraburkholderia lycopersici TaxID=416944 RepID=A0A1G6K509_9BURK|nr:HipA domain-containing protein [Paraburkholderia lycopersici]SDC26044.1 HipA-like C-terminal domain-containing protein [Paraburkholderia lycopersici]
MTESIEPRRQQTIIDVVHWEADAEFGVFPQGARAKEAVFSPAEVPDPCITPKKRYLFKRSKKSYPDQFWGEIVAYRVGCAMGLWVPPAFAAVNSGTGYSAALIEWFYDPPQRFVHAGDFMQRLIKDFDRTRGTQHNLASSEVLMRAFVKAELIQENWKQWLADMFVFDTVIGNTDRHQDNWGFIFDGSGTCRLAPLFDNGTSLGHERFIERIASWGDREIASYVAKGHHHMGLDRAAGCMSSTHIALVEHALAEWPETHTTIVERLDLLEGCLPDLLNDLTALAGDVPLIRGRAHFMLRLIAHRLALLRTVTQ